jgi:group I intron endonuclease
MSIGIYMLQFQGTNKVYIGQSKRLEDRYLDHIKNMRANKSSRKLQKAYEEYGVPNMEILCICNSSELDSIENEIIAACDSVENGFNTMNESGHISQLYGDACGNSKYSNSQIIEIFDLLVDFPDLTHSQITEITGIGRSVICDISIGNTHKWLEKEFPDKYKTLQNLKGNRRKNRRHALSRGISYPTIISPEGVEYNITSIRGFAREHDLNPNALGMVLRQSNGAASHKGWKLKQ